MPKYVAARKNCVEWLRGDYLWVKVSREGKGPLLVVRRKLGHAVVRNRLKRRLRSILRMACAQESDIVVLAREGAVDASFAALRAELLQLLERLNMRITR